MIFKPSTFYIIVHTYTGLQVEIQLTPIMQVNIIASTASKSKTSGTLFLCVISFYCSYQLHTCPIG